MVSRAHLGLAALGVAVLVVGLGYTVISIWDHEALVRWMSEQSPVPFFIAMAVVSSIGIPLSPLLVIAGATFGVWVGLIGSLAAIALALCIGYAIAHSKLRPRIVSLLDRFDYDVPDFAAGGRAAWRFAAAIKLTPAFPTLVKTYVLAVTAVPFPIYFGVSLGISGLFAVLWIVVGDSLLAHAANNLAIAAVAIAVLAVIAVIWWRRRRGGNGGDALAAG